MEETHRQRKYRHIVSVHDKVIGIRELIKEHTYLLWVLVVPMIFVTLVQFHDPWEGDMWAYPDHEWMFRHQWVDMVDEILGPSDDDGFLIGHFYNDSETDCTVPAHHDPEHPAHPLYIERILDSHWESTLLTWVLHLNFLLFGTLALRYYFIKRKQSVISLVIQMWIFTLAIAAQTIANFLRLGVIIFTPSIWALIGIFLNFICLITEISAFIELYQLRGLAMYMTKTYHELAPKQRQNIDAEIVAHDETAKDNPFAFANLVIDFFVTATHAVSSDNLARRYNLPKIKAD